ncbi:MAG TPA: hypothetical protein DDX29_02440 [Clostridiales bacterium]|nr:hypothetical protein [Clostridiales bacterium]
MNNDNLFDYARIFNEIPNAPFLYHATLERIIKFLEGLGIKNISEKNKLNQGAYALDNYCLYVKFSRGNPNSPLIIDSHIDHPGFVLNDRGVGIAFGSIGLSRLKKLLDTSPPDIDIYNNKGEFQCRKKIKNYKYDAKPIIELEDNNQVPNNSHGIWHLPTFSEDSDFVYMKNADNMIASAIMMSLINDIANQPTIYKNIEVTFIFSFLEEVFEVSATHVALKRNTPFDVINTRCNIIVLESMQSVPLHSDENILQNKLGDQNLKDLRLFEDQVFYSPELRQKFINEKSINDIYSKYGLNLPNYEDGLFVKINDTDCVYGIHFKNQQNTIEEKILNIVESENIPYQHTVSGGACNGTSYSLFPTTSSVVTLNIPNRYKHNIGDDGAIVPEQIKKDDIANVYKILSNLLLFNTNIGPSKGLSTLLKSSNLSYDMSVLRKLQIERSNVAWGAQKRLARRKYFPDDLIEETIFGIRGIKARLRERMKII